MSRFDGLVQSYNLPIDNHSIWTSAAKTLQVKKCFFFFINPRVFNWVRACCATATRVPKEHAKKWLQALRDRKAEKMQEHEKLRQMGLQQQIRRNQLLSNKRGISDVEGVSYFLLSYLVNYPSPYLLN